MVSYSISGIDFYNIENKNRTVMISYEKRVEAVVVWFMAKIP